jgi:hypothetical protein
MPSVDRFVAHRKSYRAREDREADQAAEVTGAMTHSGGEEEAGGRAGARRAADLGLAAMQRDQVVRQRKAEAEAGYLASHPVGGALERPHDPRHVQGDTGAGIVDVDVHTVIGCEPDAHAHRAALIGELDGVRQEIEQDLARPRTVRAPPALSRCPARSTPRARPPSACRRAPRHHANEGNAHDTHDWPRRSVGPRHR